jgi:hypothetical protein
MTLILPPASSVRVWYECCASLGAAAGIDDASD